MLNRKVTYRLYPTAAQQHRLNALFDLHRELYNAALQHRQDAWRVARHSVSFAEQCRELTKARAAIPELATMNAQSQQVTLKRVDRAFRTFFRRLKAKKGKAGFPRFKSRHRFRGWGYKTHGDGWTFHPGEHLRHGALRLQGVGQVKVRGKARTAGTAKTCEIVRRAGRWYASITILCSPQRKTGREELGLDWGVESFVTLSTGETVQNPRFVRTAERRIRCLSRDLARKKRGSRNRSRARRRLAREHKRIANQRSNFLHQTSSQLVKRARLLATEDLEVKNMTASAKGTKDNPGRRVKQKAGLNRAILDGSPATFLAMLRYKAAEAGIAFIEVPTKSVAPSQTCPACWGSVPKELRERWHLCPHCGGSMPRDQAAALVCLKYAKRVGNRPGVEGKVASPSKHETHSVAA